MSRFFDNSPGLLSLNVPEGGGADAEEPKRLRAHVSQPSIYTAGE